MSQFFDISRWSSFEGCNQEQEEDQESEESEESLSSDDEDMEIGEILKKRNL